MFFFDSIKQHDLQCQLFLLRCWASSTAGCFRVSSGTPSPESRNLEIGSLKSAVLVTPSPRHPKPPECHISRFSCPTAPPSLPLQTRGLAGWSESDRHSTAWAGRSLGQRFLAARYSAGTFALGVPGTPQVARDSSNATSIFTISLAISMETIAD